MNLFATSTATKLATNCRDVGTKCNFRSINTPENCGTNSTDSAQVMFHLSRSRGAPILRQYLAIKTSSGPFQSIPFSLAYQTESLRYHLQAHRYSQQRTMSSQSPPSRRTTPFPIGDHVRGKSGVMYKIEEVLSDRRDPLLCVYRASDAQGKSFIVKNMIPDEFEYPYKLQQSLASSSNLRAMIDAIPDQEILIYPYLAGDLLRISQKQLSVDARKAILKNVLMGLAELHDRRIVHTDIKPNNILVDYEDSPEGNISVKSVKISDLEDAVQLEPDQNLLGCLCGNQLWRSPESWLRARQNTPSDIFSFAITAIYVMLDEMIFLVPDEELADGKEAWQAILMRHVSYFGDNDGFQGFLEHIEEDNPMFESFIELALQVKPRKLFSEWQYVDPEFRDLVVKMTNLDPSRRITAREALEHKWFMEIASLST